MLTNGNRKTSLKNYVIESSHCDKKTKHFMTETTQRLNLASNKEEQVDRVMARIPMMAGII
jgi:hypothetical protein